MKDSQQIWLESLPPDVRAEAEAEIALYDSPDVEEWIDIDDDWVPPKDGGMGLTVDFTREEISLLSRAYGASVEMFEIMHDALIERAQAALAERGESESDTVTAAD